MRVRLAFAQIVMGFALNSESPSIGNAVSSHVLVALCVASGHTHALDSFTQLPWASEVAQLLRIVFL